jgi:hypothetical protein
VAWLDLTVVVLMKVAGYSNAAVWCVTWGLGSVVYYLGCSTFVAFGERRIVIRYYGTQVVMGVACCVSRTRHTWLRQHNNAGGYGCSYTYTVSLRETCFWNFKFYYNVNVLIIIKKFKMLPVLM